MSRIECPHCGYKGRPADFTYIYESTIYVINGHAEKEERERPVLVVCPRCKQGFFLEDPYRKFKLVQY